MEVREVYSKHRHILTAGDDAGTTTEILIQENNTTYYAEIAFRSVRDRREY